MTYLSTYNYTMRAKNIGYRLVYIVRNYYNDHKFIVYLPISIILGLIIGIIISAHNSIDIANFIDLLSNNEYNYGSAFIREIMLLTITMIGISMTLVGKWCHIIAILSLILFGYKSGYIIAGVISGNITLGIVQIIFINIPFLIVESTIIIVYYATIWDRSFCSIHRRFRCRKLILSSCIFLLTGAFAIVVFHIFIPKVYFVIFLT